MAYREKEIADPRYNRLGTGEASMVSPFVLPIGALILLICATLALSLSPRAFADGDFTRSYAKGRSLTREQETIVIDLALRAGISNIAEIATYNIPSTNFAIRVKERENIQGRVVTYRHSHVCFKGWNSRTPRPDDIQAGDYWVQAVVKDTLTILIVEGKSYRLELHPALTVEEAESVLSRVLTLPMVADPKIKGQASRLEDIDLQTALSMRTYGDKVRYEIWFKLKGESTHCVVSISALKRIDCRF